MKRAAFEALCRRCVMGSCLCISACTTAPPAAVERPAPAAVKSWARLAQRGYGAEAVFAQCRGAACPQPSPKTWGAAPTAVPPTTPQPAAAPIPLLDSMAPGEQAEMPADPAVHSTDERADPREPP